RRDREAQLQGEAPGARAGRGDDEAVEGRDRQRSRPGAADRARARNGWGRGRGLLMAQEYALEWGVPSHEEMAERLAAARTRLAGVAHVTPVLRSRQLDEACGASVFLKCENLQRMGAFKFRGAWNAISALPADVRRSGVVAYSSGNHAQAVALAARLLGVP